MRIALVLLLAAAPALAQRFEPSRPYEEDGWGRRPLEGIYLGIAGGGQLMIVPSSDFDTGDAAFGYDGELRLGYSVGVPLQIYLSGSIDGSTFGAGFNQATLRTEMIAVFLQTHLYARPQLMVYARGGIGVGLSADVTVDGTSTAGFAAAGGLGFEIRLQPGLYLAPEVFYKNMDLSGLDVSMIGLQLGLVYY